MADALKVGGEFLVNTQTAGDQEQPTTTGLANGGFVVTWYDRNGTQGDTDGTSIRAQMFGASGAKVGNEFLVNTQTASSQYNPNTTGLANGGFVVTWYDYSGTLGDKSESSIKAQVFGADGAKVGTEFLVNTQTAHGQYSPVVTGLAGGGFVVAWEDGSGTLGDSTDANIKAQVFGATGAKVGTEFLVNTQTGSFQDNPAITSLANGGFVVTWYDGSGTLGDSTTSVKAQVFGADGAKVGGEFLVNTQTVGNQGGPTITDLANGGFVVSWYDLGGTPGDGSGASIRAQVFGADGTKAGSEFVVSTHTAGPQAVTGLSNGGFVVTWQDYMGTLGDSVGFSVKLQMFTAAGAKVGAEFLVNTQTANDQSVPKITDLKNGSFVVTWQDNSGTLGDNSGNSIKARMFSFSSGSSIITGTAENDLVTGTSGVDQIKGLAGNDLLNGGLGDDTLIGGTGNDIYMVNSMGDKVVEKPDEGADTVQTSLAKYVLGGNVENLTFTDGAAHTGVGNALANTITGGSGNDRLDGRGGDDTLIGGTGNDSYVVNAAGDQVIEAVGAGTDTVSASVSFTLAANVENLTLSETSSINGIGNEGANSITGNDGANTLSGLVGNDRLAGGAGNDALYGGLGKDVLTGGAGADKFVFDTAPDSALNLDKVTDFVSGTDKLVFDKTVFAAFTATGGIGAEAFYAGAGVNAAHDASDRFLYNTTTGVLRYDADGTGASKAVQVAVLAGHPDLAFGDILIVA